MIISFIISYSSNIDFTTLPAYSSTEVDTKQIWTNGKKIYRRCFSGNFSVTAGTRSNILLVSSAGIEAIINCGGSMNYDPNGINAVPFSEGSGEYAMIYVQGSSGNLYLARMSSSNRTNLPYNVWVEYTKTS